MKKRVTAKPVRLNVYVFLRARSMGFSFPLPFLKIRRSERQFPADLFHISAGYDDQFVIGFNLINVRKGPQYE